MVDPSGPRPIALATCSRSHPLLNMNIEGNFEATLWRHRWCHHHEKIFFDIIWDDLFISEVRLKQCLIYQNFQNGRHFELSTNFFTGIYTGSWIYQKDSHEHFQHFELLIDALTQILTEKYQFSKFDLLCDLVTSSMMSWICIHTNVVIISWYWFRGSLMMISLLDF